jgi:hypothetical protein
MNALPAKNTATNCGRHGFPYFVWSFLLNGAETGGLNATQIGGPSEMAMARTRQS